MTIVCYPQPGKRKAMIVCEAFAAGARSVGVKVYVCTSTPPRLHDGDCFFYGVRPAWAHLWSQCKADGRTYFYGDNSYFDVSRETYFRVTKNSLQHTGLGQSDGKRFAALGIKIKPMRSGGENVIVCPSTPEFMQVVAGDPGWLDRVTRNMREQYGAARVIVRTKQDKRPLLADLGNARLLVTWGSAAAVTALLEGVPVACAPECCATYASDRAKWAAVLADQQFSLDEFRSGFAWEMLASGA